MTKKVPPSVREYMAAIGKNGKGKKKTRRTPKKS
jgi:hypothetical protein